MTHMSGIQAAVVGLVLSLCSGMALAQVNVPAGATVDLAKGQLTLGCTDLQVAGTLAVGAGGAVTEVRDVLIEPGGLAQLDGGSLELAGHWNNRGQVAGPGSVQRVAVNVPGCTVTGVLGPIPLGRLPSPVPTLDSAALALLALALGALGIRGRRCSKVR